MDRLDIAVESKMKIVSFIYLLMMGSKARNEVKEMLCLVIILRHDDVKRDCPTSDLVKLVEATADRIGSKEEFKAWQEAVAALFIKENESSLTLDQVSTYLYITMYSLLSNELFGSFIT